MKQWNITAGSRWQELAKMPANKELKAHVSLTFPFDEMAEAI